MARNPTLLRCVHTVHYIWLLVEAQSISDATTEYGAVNDRNSVRVVLRERTKYGRHNRTQEMTEAEQKGSTPLKCYRVLTQ